jgi:hypothetical protein
LGVGLKPSLQQLESLARLRGSPDFARFLEVSQEYERELTERAVSSTDTVQMHRAAGGVLAIRELRELYHSAPESVTKMSGKQRNTP